jgi:SMC interacting uncharacterized protein involved in chromosome segregation
MPQPGDREKVARALTEMGRIRRDEAIMGLPGIRDQIEDLERRYRELDSRHSRFEGRLAALERAEEERRRSMRSLAYDRISR